MSKGKNSLDFGTDFPESSFDSSLIVYLSGISRVPEEKLKGPAFKELTLFCQTESERWQMRYTQGMYSKSGELLAWESFSEALDWGATLRK